MNKVALYIFFAAFLFLLDMVSLTICFRMLTLPNDVAVLCGALGLVGVFITNLFFGRKVLDDFS